jgi:hypothetical protein
VTIVNIVSDREDDHLLSVQVIVASDKFNRAEDGGVRAEAADG